MNDRQKKLIEKLGLSKNDFESKDIVSNEERINDLEIALCELLDAIMDEEQERNNDGKSIF